MTQIQNSFTPTAGREQPGEGPAEVRSVQVLMALHDIKEAELTLKVIRDFNLVTPLFWVRDGEEALDFLLGRGFFANRAVVHRPKLAILDADLPHIGGLGVIQQVQNAENNQALPTILLVSSGQAVDALPATIARRCGVLVRPLDFDSLKQAIGDLMNPFIPQPASEGNSPLGRDRHSADDEISVERIP